MRSIHAVVLASLVCSALAWPTHAAPPDDGPKENLTGNYDARVLGRRDVARVAAAVATPASKAAADAVVAARRQTLSEGLRDLRSIVPGAAARLSPATAGPEMVEAGARPLSAPAAGAGFDIVRAFLRTHASLYGLADHEIESLHFLGESRSPSGLRMVRVEQRIDGHTVFQSETRFALDAQGRVWRSLGALVPQVSRLATPQSVAISAPRALRVAMESVGIVLDEAKMTSRKARSGRAETELVVRDSPIAGPVASELVYFPLAPGVVVPAWRQLVFTSGESDWYTIVDATTGTLLWRKDMREHASTEEARFSVYVQADGVTPADSPAPHSPTSVNPGDETQFPEIARTDVAMSVAQNLVASPDGWIPDGGSTTTGNNVDAYLDAVNGGPETNVPDVGALDSNGRPVGNPDVATNDRDFLGAAPRDFGYAPAPLAGDPDMGDAPTLAAFRRGAVTQLFYVTNWYHDQLFALGFDEAAGNFQQTNFSGMGSGGDRVLAEAQDGSGTNNANFSTPPDGMSGRMQMFRFTFPAPDRDGDLDSEIVIHELTHGLSNRLVGNADGLIWSVGRSLGEGWSDFYALSLLNGTNGDDPDGSYATGGYATYNLVGLTDNYLYGIRRFPFSTDNGINPLTWADVDGVTADMSGGIAVSPLGFEFAGGLEVHNAGEVWTVTLWEVRSRIIADPAGAAGDVPTGNQTMLQLVTDALKMTPANPSFLDARDALLAADCLTNACANERWIWEGFADRGLGYGAVAPLGHMGFANFGHVSVGESFAVPHLDLSAIGALDDSLGNGNGSIDPGEPIALTLEILNPWLGAAFDIPGATATLTSSTPGITILDGTAIYGPVAAGTAASGDPFVFIVSSAAVCGQSIALQVETTSALGTSTFDLTLRVGAVSGTGAPVTFTSMPALGIPDGDSRGVFDTMTIVDDLEIADLDFRLDSLTHTFTGDLTVLLRGPNGLGGDLIWLREILFGGGDGDNFVGTVIDDGSANDLNQSFPTDAPFTGDWAPAFNSPVWLLFGDPALFPDAVGLLSRYDGMSTQGDWQVLVADHFDFDTGTLNTWSLIVTPTAFSCAAFAAAADLDATKTVAGDFTVGGLVTYTVTLTNDGTAVQDDNPGDELTDVLPPELTLVSASATSGTAVATVLTNTVTWNGSVAPLGGSVTVTITATVDAGSAGSSVSNQGSISWDSDDDGANDSVAATDDPTLAGASDPTVFLVAAPVVSATKEASGDFAVGGTVVYTIVLSNTGGADAPDNPGDELVDVLPAELSLLSASATSGTAVANPGTNTVTWNGIVPAGGDVTITIEATIDGAEVGTTVLNQGTVFYDGDLDGSNESATDTDDPAAPGSADPTGFVVGGSVIEIPTLSVLGSLLLAALLLAVGTLLLRRRTEANRPGCPGSSDPR